MHVDLNYNSPGDVKYFSLATGKILQCNLQNEEMYNTPTIAISRINHMCGKQKVTNSPIEKRSYKDPCLQYHKSLQWQDFNDSVVE